MFSFIHAADIHLDSPLRGLSRYESAPVEAIRSACRRAFRQLIDLAINEKVAFVLLAGDLYDGDWKDFSTGIFFSQQMGRLQQHGIDVFLIKGNHDAANSITKSLQLPKNVTLFSHKKPETVELEKIGVAIHGQSFAHKSISENLVKNYPVVSDNHLFHIGLLHTSLTGRPNHDNYAPCSLDDLQSKNYHYWALGHIHQNEIVQKDPYVVFPGCIQGRHIKESGPKGCMLVEVDDTFQLTIIPKRLDHICWQEIICPCEELSTKEELFQDLRTKIEQELDPERVVALRITLKGESELAHQLAQNPEQLEQELRALGAELSEDSLWIEQIKNQCTSTKKEQDELVDASALTGLLTGIEETATCKESIEGVEEMLTTFRNKIPAEALNRDFGLTDDDMGQLIKEAKELLIAQISGKGELK